MVLGSYNHWCSEEPDHEIGREVCRDVQQCACGRGYRRAAHVSSFCTLADGVVVQMIYCTDNGRLPCRWKSVSGVYEDGRARLTEVHPFVSCSHVGEVWKSAPLLSGVFDV
jgi:hypothetical protein